MDDILKQKEISKEEKPEIELSSSRSLIKWEDLEYEYLPKSNNWFWSIGVIAVGLIFASILLDNFLFAILILIAGLAVILLGAKKPKRVIFSLTAKGFQIDKNLFPYENLRSFWIHYEPPYKKILAIEPKKFFMPVISVPLGDTNPNVVREHLLKFLKEERREESFIQTIIRLIRF